MSGAAIQRAFVDKCYKGARLLGPGHGHPLRVKTGLTPQMKREFKRQSAIEPMIGHAKNEAKLGKNHLLGHHGNKFNALLAASGHKLRLILNALAFRFARILAALLGPFAKLDTWPQFPVFAKSSA